MAWGAFDKLRKGLSKTRRGLVGRLTDLFGGRVRLDTETLDGIEEVIAHGDTKASIRLADSRR